MPKLLALLFAISCAHIAADPESPSEDRPVKSQKAELKTQHFCCEKVDLDDHSGKGCSAISKELINSCDEVLYCPAGWGKSAGVVQCH